MVLLSALTAAVPPVPAAASPASVERGRRLAESNCKACHAIAGRRTSPLTEAPPFAEFQQRFPGRSIEEIFAAAMASDHPPMPSFLGSGGDMQDLLDYLRSVQAAPPPR